MSANSDRKADRVADDILWGVAQISEEIGVEQRRCFYLLERGLLPGQKVGRSWTALRSKLRAHLRGEAA